MRYFIVLILFYCVLLYSYSSKQNLIKSLNYLLNLFRKCDIQEHYKELLLKVNPIVQDIKNDSQTLEMMRIKANFYQ